MRRNVDDDAEERELTNASETHQLHTNLKVAALREAQRPTTANTKPVPDISDSALRQMVLVSGILPQWGGDLYEEDALPPPMTTKQRSYFGKRYRILTE